MLPNPKPSNVQEALRALEDGIDLRKLHCAKYSECLNRTVDLRWKGFKCIECAVEENISAEQEVSDMVGLMQVMTEAFKPEEEEA